MPIRVKSRAALEALTQPRAREAKPRKPRRHDESDLMRGCLALLKLRNVFAWRANAGGGLRRGRDGRTVPVKGNPAGTPDILAIVGGRLVGIELKSRSGTLRPSQAAWRAGLLAAGGMYWIIRDVQQLSELLDDPGRAADDH